MHKQASPNEKSTSPSKRDDFAYDLDFLLRMASDEHTDAETIERYQERFVDKWAR